MEPTTPTPADVLADTVAWIETQLDQPLTVDRIAAHAQLSPYHFSRVFTARVGHGVMAHVRGRRMVRGARRLVEDPRTKLLDLALDCGFESQQAFTRAFKRVFGVSPGRFRRGFAVTPIEGQFPMNLPDQVRAQVSLLPGRVTLDAFEVAGCARRFDDSDKSDIPQLWARLVGRLPFPGQAPSWNTYGVVWSADRETGSFQYMAAVGIEPGASLPEGFERMTIPKATYAVFRITLTGGALHPQVKAAMATIWGELVPASGMTVSDTPDFELYDGEFSPNRAAAVIDFHVPVVI